MPDHYFDVGIAEQHAVLFAAGLALEGAQAGLRDLLDVPAARLRPDRPRRLPAEAQRRASRWTAPASSATTARRTTAPSTSPTCAALPNIVLMAPRDEAMLVHMLHTALTYDDGPVAPALPARRGGRRRRCREQPQAIEIGTGEILREGEGAVALVGYGSGVGKALEAAELLRRARASTATVADARFAKPLDAGAAAPSSPPSTSCS